MMELLRFSLLGGERSFRARNSSEEWLIDC